MTVKITRGSATRFYSIGGQLAATRTGSSTVDLMVADREGTSLLAIDSQTLALTQRYYDPYGNPIGPPPSTWPGEQGYVGGTADPATSLTNLNAASTSRAPAHSSHLTRCSTPRNRRI